MLQSSYTSRRLADRIRITVSWIRIRRRKTRRPNRRDHLLGILVYLHPISSAVVRLCPERNLKVIRLLSEGFLAGVKGGRTRLSSQYSRPTADDYAIAGLLIKGLEG